MNKLDMAIFIVAELYGAPFDMIPETHKDVLAYMRLSKVDLKLKFDNIGCIASTFQAEIGEHKNGGK